MNNLLQNKNEKLATDLFFNSVANIFDRIYQNPDCTDSAC